MSRCRCGGVHESVLSVWRCGGELLWVWCCVRESVSSVWRCFGVALLVWQRCGESVLSVWRCGSVAVCQCVSVWHGVIMLASDD